MPSHPSTPTVAAPQPRDRRPTTAARLHRFFESACDRTPGAIALDCERRLLTYRQLDAQANQLAHHLRALGVGGGSRVALLLPRSSHTYVSLLAVGKAGAAFVPIDPGAPPDRVAYILDDAGADLVLTVSGLASRCAGTRSRVVALDAEAAVIAGRATTRPEPEPGGEADPLAYVMYTSGSTGRPKGVRIAQSSICNFLEVVPEIYDVRPDDRVYQGMTISFDFSIEEIWPTWAVGATLVAGANDSRRLGDELADFLTEHAVTVLYCVPTLLATIPRELPRVRSVLVGGEACPAQLVERWARPGRRILNTYGPTEATVTATWAELRPGRPVTIGVPLPTYSVVLLDEHREAVPDGEIGEICIGGPGVARGYVGRPDLTAERFVEHPLAPPGGRLYRTGDLGRMTRGGEIEYLGRADTEVKIRGHRVDLAEIDNVLLELPGVAEAVAALMPVTGAGGDVTELAAYLVPAPFSAEDPDALVGRLRDHLRDRLPTYMIPSFVDIIAELPTMPSGKVDRTRLPAPSGRRLSGTGQVVAAAGEAEEQVLAAFAETFGTPPGALSVEADFFADLGGHSLAAARVVSLLRETELGASLAVRDLYAHPSVRALAEHLGTVAALPVEDAGRPEAVRHGGGRIARAGAVQAVLIYLVVLALSTPLAYALTGGVVDPVRIVGLSLGGFLAVRWLLPVLLVRPLTAGIRPGRYRLWGRAYLRIWAAQLVLSISPLTTLSGSPLLAPYLRLLGARVGRRTTIATHLLGLPGLVRVGDDATVGYGVVLNPWRVADGWVFVDRVEIGPGAFVGNNSVLEPGARLGAGAALGEQSALGPDSVVPAGARWAGSPASPVEALAPPVEALLSADANLPGWRVRHFAAAGAGLLALEVVGIATVLPSVLLTWWAATVWGPLAGLGTTLATGPVYVLTVCVVVALGKRLVLPRTPVGTHPARSLLGVRKWLSDKVFELSLTTTNALYATLYTAPWLRLLGARIGRGSEVSTASHVDPDLLTLGDGSFLADMASVGPAVFANGRMSLQRTEVGSRAFVGNAALVPAGTTLPGDSLVGVSTLAPAVPIEEGTSWLGSPAMHLPARQDSGTFPEELTFRPTRRAVVLRLVIEFFRAVTPASMLGLSVYAYVLAVQALGNSRGALAAIVLSPLLAVAAGAAVIAWCAAAKRLLVGTYRPRTEPLWSLWVRRTEFVTALYETAAVPAGVGMLGGTPFLPPVLRLFGARIGRRTWIATTYLTEFDLVEVGDDAAVAATVSLQTHLFEDRVMKMSRVTVRPRASVGTRSVVLYDSVVGEDVALGALSLAMKGEHLAPGTSWHGIPAQRVTGGAGLVSQDLAADERKADVR
ncbi:Pls/PosA family non-ribosomal peptide synthetase [Amycolatopsis samaneae]|uniref:Pls/PosA family non-ribosomal peptide synthetase n=1 Tax=Amycolatopsis samaneae TaxID=664691 RepID=A0ABW5G6Q2_9PSEU